MFEVFENFMKLVFTVHLIKIAFTIL